MKVILATLVSVLLILIMTTGCENGGNNSINNTKDDGINALILVPKNHGLNYQLMREVIDQYGWNVTHTGVFDTITACPPVIEGLAYPSIIPDVKVGEIEDIEKYDCLILVPATGSYYEVPDSHHDLINSPAAMELLQKFRQSNMPIFSTCAGVRVFAAAGIIDGLEISGSPRFKDEYEEAGAIYLGKDKGPIVSENVITSTRGQLNSIGNIVAISSIIENNRLERGSKNFTKEKTIFSEEAIFTNGDIEFSHTYGGFASDGGFDFIELEDGGFLIAGYTYSEGSGDADILIINTNEKGIIRWTKSYGGMGSEYAYSCTQTKDGDFLITGYTTSFGAGGKDMFLLKIDNNGNEVWMKEFGGEDWDVGKSVCVTRDNHYLVCGFTRSFTEGEEDIYVIKTDSDGNEIWSKSYGGERLEMGNSIFEAEDGSYFIGATSGTYQGGNSDIYVIKTDRDGKQIWDKTYQGNGELGYGFDWANEVKPSSSGGYLITGNTDCNQLMDACLINVDKDGEDKWQASIGPGFYHFGSESIETQEGQYVIAGTVRMLASGSDIYLAKFKADGTIDGKERIIGAGDDYCVGVCQTRDGGIALLGYTDSFGKGKFDIFLIKLKTLDFESSS